MYLDKLKELQLAPEDSSAIFAVLLDLLKQFDRVCAEQGLCYYAHGGTLLGAIRHRGFIPWDDDIDLFMPRKDFDAFSNIASAHFSSPYYFQSYLTDPEYFRTQIRIRNSDTTCIATTDIGMRCNQGVFISIFPLDAMPEDPAAREAQCKKVVFYRKILERFVYTRQRSPSLKNAAARGFAKVVCTLFGKQRIYRRLHRACGKYADKNTRYVGMVSPRFSKQEKLLFEREDYAETLRVDFEDMKIPVPAGYDRVLTTQYGDYMKPVKDPKRWQPHSFILDVQRPYTYYWERIAKVMEKGVE